MVLRISLGGGGGGGSWVRIASWTGGSISDAGVWGGPTDQRANKMRRK